MKLKDRPPRQGRQLQLEFDPPPPSGKLSRSPRRFRLPDDPRWWASFTCPTDAEFTAFMREDSEGVL